MRMVAAAFLPLVLITTPLATAEDWDRFRGPNGAGVARDTGYPVDFGDKDSALWRTPVRPGKSSPVLTARHIFVSGSDGGKLFTQCLDLGEEIFATPALSGGPIHIRTAEAVYCFGAAPAPATTEAFWFCVRADS